MYPGSFVFALRLIYTFLWRLRVLLGRDFAISLKSQLEVHNLLRPTCARLWARIHPHNLTRHGTYTNCRILPLFGAVFVFLFSIDLGVYAFESVKVVFVRRWLWVVSAGVSSWGKKERGGILFCFFLCISIFGNKYTSKERCTLLSQRTVLRQVRLFSA